MDRDATITEAFGGMKNKVFQRWPLLGFGTKTVANTSETSEDTLVKDADDGLDQGVKYNPLYQDSDQESQYSNRVPASVTVVSEDADRKKSKNGRFAHPLFSGIEKNYKPRFRALNGNVLLAPDEGKHASRGVREAWSVATPSSASSGRTLPTTSGGDSKQRASRSWLHQKHDREEGSHAKQTPRSGKPRDGAHAGAEARRHGTGGSTADKSDRSSGTTTHGVRQLSPSRRLQRPSYESGSTSGVRPQQLRYPDAGVTSSSRPLIADGGVGHGLRASARSHAPNSNRTAADQGSVDRKQQGIPSASTTSQTGTRRSEASSGGRTARQPLQKSGSTDNGTVSESSGDTRTTTSGSGAPRLDDARGPLARPLLEETDEADAQGQARPLASSSDEQLIYAEPYEALEDVRQAIATDVLPREQPDGAEPTTVATDGKPSLAGDTEKADAAASPHHHHHHHHYHVYRLHESETATTPTGVPTPCPVHGPSPHPLADTESAVAASPEPAYLCPVHGADTADAAAGAGASCSRPPPSRQAAAADFGKPRRKADLSDIEEVPEPTVDYSDSNDDSQPSSFGRRRAREPSPDYSSAERLYKQLKAKLSFARRQLKSGASRSAPELDAAPPTPSVDYSSYDSQTSGDESSWTSSPEDDVGAVVVGRRPAVNPACAIHGQEQYYQGVHFAQRNRDSFYRANALQYAGSRATPRSSLYSKFYTPSFSPIIEEEEKTLRHTTPPAQKKPTPQDARSFNINAYVYTINSNVYSVGQTGKDELHSRASISKHSSKSSVQKQLVSIDPHYNDIVSTVKAQETRKKVCYLTLALFALVVCLGVGIWMIIHLRKYTV
ncbi:PREDICTED: uncharacterized protein LOC106813355 [Priapulus caudatus]|uniref:Uncharacterized protein LOC106813355 n=1 Tax=Priapulus caudatus TaxID=37621 RepID=A0ABM1ELA3_PRICU|nr:PREDICTED: uncharacterized protein LOC106813355 [Priapulus caudatus]